MSTKSVCIIGAGAAGLCALRHFTSRPDAFDPVECFEQTDRVGGTWNYTEDTGHDANGLPIHSSMYRDMKTNLPLSIMDFPDFQSSSTESYVHHSRVLRYLNDYADHFHLRPFIRFEHYLTKVTRRDESKNAWLVTIRDLPNSKTFTRSFDVIILCPGRYCVPKIPPIDSISQFTGAVIHSHNYRFRETFRGQRVAVIGAGPSGIDICFEVATVAKEVVLLNRNRPFSSLPVNVRQIKGEIQGFASKSITIQVDEEPIEYHIDAVIFATGYHFNLNYLDEESCGLRLNDDKTIPGIYRHLINIEQPTMAVLSVLVRILPFPLFHQQILFFMKTILGEVQLPSKETMIAQVEREFAQRKALGFRPQDRHLANVELQEEYHRCLVQEGHLQPLPPVTFKLYQYLGKVREKNIQLYKEKKYRLINEEEFEEIEEE